MYESTISTTKQVAAFNDNQSGIINYNNKSYFLQSELALKSNCFIPNLHKKQINLSNPDQDIFTDGKCSHIVNQRKHFVNTKLNESLQYNQKMNMKKCFNNSILLNDNLNGNKFIMPLNYNNAPSNCSENVNKQINYARYKTELCRQFNENGTCKYGDKCQFAHGQRELKIVNRHPKYKSELCQTFHSTGFCAYGPRCNFVHDPNENEKYNCMINPLPVQSSKYQYSPMLINCEKNIIANQTVTNLKSNEEISCNSSGSISPSSSSCSNSYSYSSCSATPPPSQHNIKSNQGSPYLKMPISNQIDVDANSENVNSPSKLNNISNFLNMKQSNDIYQYLYSKLISERTMNIINNDELSLLERNQQRAVEAKYENVQFENSFLLPYDAKQKLMRKLQK